MSHVEMQEDAFNLKTRLHDWISAASSLAGALRGHCVSVFSVERSSSARARWRGAESRRLQAVIVN